jgi:hypothetical protein
MRISHFLIAVSALTCASAEEFTLSQGNIGPITVESQINSDGKRATLVTTAVNRTNRPIAYARFCVSLTGGKCPWKLWTTAEWPAGKEMKWTLDLKKAIPNGAAHVVTIDQLKAGVATGPPIVKNQTLEPIKRIYVEAIEGDSGAMARERLQALIANSVRFKLVEDKERADAFLRGRAESKEGSAFRSQSSSASIGNASGSGSAIGAIASVAAAANSIGGSQSAASGGTYTVFTVVLRLVDKQGETVWAWDGTKPCAAAVGGTACATADLVLAAR